MNVIDNDDFADIESRLRRDLGPLADAMLDQPAATSTDLSVAAVFDAGASPVSDGGAASFLGLRSSRRWLVAAAAVLLAIGAAAIWQIADGNNRIETEPIAPGPGPGEAELGRWIDLPPAPDGVTPRGHMVSVWTGDEALFWGGRSAGAAPEAFVGGVAYNPTTDSWREIEAPEWVHPGASGVYLDGWVYLSAKGSVTRFDPDTGAEEEITLDPRFGSMLTVATDGTEVFAFGSVSSGLGYQVVGPAVGELQVFDEVDEINAALVARGGEMNAMGWRRDNFILVLADQSSYGFTLEGGPAVTGNVLPPAGPGDYRVELVNTSNGPLVIHLETEGGRAVNVYDPIDGNEWGIGGGFDDLDSVTVVGAGEWVVLLEPGRNQLLLAPPTHATSPALTATPTEPPLESLNPNAVWTGAELIVWGGNSPSGPDIGPDTRPVGGRIIVPAAAPHRDTDPDPGGDFSPEAAEESIGDETEFQMLERLVTELPDSQRIPTGPYDEAGNERFDYQWTAEGLWVYSRPEPTEPGPAMDAGEILLLEDWGGPILDSWLLGYFPGGSAGQLEVSDDAVYCMYDGDGGLPDSQFCRIDRLTGELSVVIHPSEIDGGDEAFYTDFYADSDIDWRVVPAGSPGAVRPFGWLYMEEAPTSDTFQPNVAAPTIVDESSLVRLDPDSLEPIDVIDLAATGERIFPCPFRDEGFPEVPEFDLPPAVATTRQAILEAAATCDADALRDLSGGQLMVSNRDGGWGMIALAAMLAQAPDVVQGGAAEDGQTFYLFPAASADASRGAIDAVSRFYGAGGDDHLTIIGEDGSWMLVSP